MAITLRAAEARDLEAASALCLRSKAWWGYDADFMAACVAELTLVRANLEADAVVLAFDGDRLAGVAEIAPDGGDASLEKLFVDPDCMGAGIGRRLFEWARGRARDMAAQRLLIDADPGAVPFYERMGAVRAGAVPSGSIPGRVLPRLICDLTAARRDGSGPSFRDTP